MQLSTCGVERLASPTVGSEWHVYRRAASVRRCTDMVAGRSAKPATLYQYTALRMHS